MRTIIKAVLQKEDDLTTQGHSQQLIKDFCKPLLKLSLLSPAGWELAHDM